LNQLDQLIEKFRSCKFQIDIKVKIKEKMLIDPLVDLNCRWVSSTSISVKQLQIRSSTKPLILTQTNLNITHYY